MIRGDPLGRDYINTSELWEQIDLLGDDLTSLEHDMTGEAKAGMAGPLVAAKREVPKLMSGWLSDREEPLWRF